MIGFEIGKEALSDFDKYFAHAFVYIGKENPFVQEKLKQILWEKIEPENFPLAKVSVKVNDYFNHIEYLIGGTYKYEAEGLQYYTQELVNGDRVFAKRLVIINTLTQEKVFENIYYSGEGSSFAPLDNQWTGKLFKNKPQVIFGFQWQSFGCPKITFINSSEKEIYINCDNRH
jgi:hypothetical protein